MWNNQRYELADELIADTVVRHGIGGQRVLTHAEAKQRVLDYWAMMDTMVFTLVQVTAEDDRVCVLYECEATPKGGEPAVVSSVEIFRVVGGRICEVWNAAKEEGRWA